MDTTVMPFFDRFLSCLNEDLKGIKWRENSNPRKVHHLFLRDLAPSAISIIRSFEEHSSAVIATQRTLARSLKNARILIQTPFRPILETYLLLHRGQLMEDFTT
jgi:hypothetical protein